MTGEFPRDGGLSAARIAKELHGTRLLSAFGAHGVGVGYRRRGGAKTGDLAVVVHVRRKLPAAYIPPHDLLPAAVNVTLPGGEEVSVPVDVQEHAPPVPETDPWTRVRPVPGGVSIGGSGTLGGWVWDTVTDQVVALSNRHVLGATAGVRVCQPSRDDGGTPARDLVASVLRAGALDAAIAVPISPDVVSASILAGGPAVFALGDAELGMRVQKSGRTTGLTHGTVDLIDYDSDYSGSHTDLWIDGDADFSDGGDSGSLYLEAAAPGPSGGPLRAVGLHWGGSGRDGVGHHLRAVFADLALAPLPPGTGLPGQAAEPPGP